jgi:hypothetical protein
MHTCILDLHLTISPSHHPSRSPYLGIPY